MKLRISQLALLFISAGAITMIWKGVQKERQRHTTSHTAHGTKIDQLNGVIVYSNGKNAYLSHGKHYAKDGYYYGHRWQCVEFVKRYYYDHYHHKMPNEWGHARSFFDPHTPDGQINSNRGLIQFVNGGKSKPQQGDIIVYDFGKYGHVAIVSHVRDEAVEIIQQNVYGQPRSEIPLTTQAGHWNINQEHLVGWLRMPEGSVTNN